MFGQLIRASVVLLFSCLVFASYVRASEKTILSVSGKLNAQAKTEYTLADLEALPQRVVRTSTPWHDGVAEFEGPLISDLLEKIGSTGETLTVIALNDYHADLPAKDAKEFNPILALKENGKHMKVRDKGPIFIIYPFDDMPAIQTQTYFSRSVWQVRKIVIK